MTINPWKLLQILASVSALTQAERVAAANFTVDREPALLFGVHEISFTGNGGVADPFATSASVTLTPPSGGARTVEMFWDGANVWRARAYVNATGKWTWTSRCAGDTGLDGKSGSFSAESSALRGKLRPHPANPRAIVTDNGQWFAPIGDTSYNLLGSAAYQDYVRDDWAHGVNFLRCSSFGHLRDYAAHFTASGPAGIPSLANLRSDDAKLKWMFENFPGIYLQYIMFPENASGNWSKYSTTAKTQLLRQMVARYGAFPTLTWQIMNDSFYPENASGDAAVAETVGAFLAAHDVDDNLRCTGARRGAGAPFAGSKWTTFLHFETKDAIAADEADRNASFNKFTWCGEDRYETYLPPAHPRYFFRRLMWAWLLSGGSACYGGDWDSITPYRKTKLSGLDSVKHIKAYFEQRNLDLGQFAYDDSVASDPLATGRDRPQVCNRGTDEYLIYHPNGSGAGEKVNVNAGRTPSFQINLSVASGTFEVEWFRCLDGVTTAGGKVEGGAVRTLGAPWTGQDVVCRIHR